TPARALPFVAFSSLLPDASVWSLPTILVEIEDEDPVTAFWPLQYFGMAQRPHRVLIPGTPMVLHGQSRELIILRLALVVPRVVNQVDDVVDLGTADPVQRLHLIAVAQLGRQLAQQTDNSRADLVNMLEVVGVGSGAARILDLFLPGGDLDEIAGKFTARAPEIHLKREDVLGKAKVIVREPFQWCVGDQAAVPIILAFDLSRGKPRRQRTARHDVLGADGVRRRIEVHEITGTHVYGPDAQPGFARIDPLKIDEALKPALQQLRLVEARGIAGTVGMSPRGRVAQRVERSGAGNLRPVCAHLIEKPACEISLERQVPQHASPVEQGICGNLFPEASQLRHALGWRGTGDNGGVNSPDGNAGDPVPVKLRL